MGTSPDPREGGAGGGCRKAPPSAKSGFSRSPVWVPVPKVPVPKQSKGTRSWSSPCPGCQAGLGGSAGTSGGRERGGSHGEHPGSPKSPWDRGKVRDFRDLVWCWTWQCWVNVGLSDRGLFQPKQFHDFPLWKFRNFHNSIISSLTLGTATNHGQRPQRRPRARGGVAVLGTFVAPQGRGHSATGHSWQQTGHSRGTERCHTRCPGLSGFPAPSELPFPVVLSLLQNSPGPFPAPCRAPADPRSHGMRSLKAWMQQGCRSEDAGTALRGWEMSLAFTVAPFPRSRRAGAGPVGSGGCGTADPSGLARWHRAQRPEELREHRAFQRGAG